MSVIASQLALAGFAFLGRSYKEMDCQEFIERCLAACGMKINFRGSNAWFREMTWTGSPEECRKLLGSVPAGAFLFIWDQDGGETKRGYHDSLGNASHIGICTGTGKGAIHSSETRGCVAESAFSGKSIPGGWNRVGLWKQITYGSKTDAFLAGLNPSVSDVNPQKGVKEKMMSYQAMVIGNGRLNMRTRADRSSPRILWLEPGTVVSVMDESGEWSRISHGGKTGYAQSAYLERFSGEPAEAWNETTENASESTSDKVLVPRKQLEAVYQAIGDILDLRG